MKRSVPAVAIITPLLLLAATQVQAVTADEIVEKQLQARGGKDTWQEVRTFRLQGTATGEGQTLKMAFTIERQRPDKIRFELERDGKRGIQGFDGKTGWAVMPYKDVFVPMEINDSKVAELREQVDLADALIYLPQGAEVKLVGSDKLENGRVVHRIEVVRPGRTTVVLLVDAETYLIYQQMRPRTMAGKTIEETRTYSDYRQVDDLLIPHTIEITSEAGNQVITYSSIELGVELDDSRFQVPKLAPQKP